MGFDQADHLARLGRDAVEIFNAGVRAADAGQLVERQLRLAGNRLEAGDHGYELDRFRRITMLGAGKAAAPMASSVLRLLGDRLTGGLVVVKEGHGLPLRDLELIEAGHPLPDRASVRAALRLLELARGAGAGDLLISLLSGGGSALAALPAPGIALADKLETTSLLLASGAAIGEINAVRKHISAIKGGQLARAARPARLLTLILSDVIGDHQATVASGPTVPDPTTFDQCLDLLAGRDLLARIPAAVHRRLRDGAQGRHSETPGPMDPLFAGSVALTVGGNGNALAGARKRAIELGYNTHQIPGPMCGEAREAARELIALARRVRKEGRPVPPPACLLRGGETTVRLPARHGSGGRNQELALASAIGLRDLTGTLLLSAGTDGSDGSTGAAGALAHSETVRRGGALGLDARWYLDRHDSHSFFRQLDDLLITGPTRTNVMDLALVLLC